MYGDILGECVIVTMSATQEARLGRFAHRIVQQRCARISVELGVGERSSEASTKAS